ncbi:MAG: carbohydrate ABC transporter permease [Spirochaetes bacterium]|nr:MAG: carbohydrate ABC transporter permease [Spirochaetota bacterium]
MVVKKKSFIRSIGFALIVLLIVTFAIFPFLQMLSLSLKYQFDWGNPSLIPRKINLKAYKELLNIGTKMRAVPDSIKRLLENKALTRTQKKSILKKYQETGNIFPFLRYFWNSFFLSFTASFISLIIAILGAYSFSRVHYKGQGIIQRGVLFVYMFGGILLLIPLYQIAIKSGLARTGSGSFISLLIIYMVQTLPVSLYMLGNYFRSIPFSIEEAALIDGCTRFETIEKVIIPLSLPAISTVFIYAFMIAWNEYLFASVFLRSYKNLYTLPVGLKALFVSKNAIWDRIMAASVLTATPVVILFMIVQKNLVSGLTSGGVKE